MNRLYFQFINEKPYYPNKVHPPNVKLKLNIEKIQK